MWKVHLSRWINYWLLNGKPDQMISSRVYVEHHVRWERVIDKIFFWQYRHCRMSFMWEIQCNRRVRDGDTTGATAPQSATTGATSR